MKFVSSLSDCAFVMTLHAGWMARVDGMVVMGGLYGTLVMTQYGGLIRKRSTYGDGVWSEWTDV